MLNVLLLKHSFLRNLGSLGKLAEERRAVLLLLVEFGASHDCSLRERFVTHV